MVMLQDRSASFPDVPTDSVQKRPETIATYSATTILRQNAEAQVLYSTTYTTQTFIIYANILSSFPHASVGAVPSPPTT
jgi:hypothetical protein